MFGLVLCIALKPESVSLGGAPPIMLWAWERPEDLRFLRGDDVGVAFLASTMRIQAGGASRAPRRQPLFVAPGTWLTAVVRVERGAIPGEAAREEIVREMARVAELPGVRAVQIDFDAAQSERAFYIDLLAAVRRALPPRIGLSMTALASWCAGDDWLSAAPLPVDEAVPMVFAMGRGAAEIDGMLDALGDFRSVRCKKSVGVSVQEPRAVPARRRLYVWNARKWNERDVASLLRRRR